MSVRALVVDPEAPAALRIGADLATLVALLAEGALSAEIGWRGPWDQVAEAVKALSARQVPGKAVLGLPAP